MVVAETCPFCRRSIFPRVTPQGRLCPLCQNRGVRPASAPWNQAPGSASTAWPAAAPKTEGLATAAVVVGIVSLVLFVVGAALGPLAIVFGVAARKRIARDANLRGSGQARAGIILGLIATLGGLAFVIGIIGAEHFW